MIKTRDTYVVTPKYTSVNGMRITDMDFCDSVVSKSGRIDAQGSHDINRIAIQYNQDGTKAAWHKVQSNRKHQYCKYTQSSRAHTSRVAYLKMGKRNLWALNALIKTAKDGTITLLKCDGYTGWAPAQYH
jgi:hypothetical protein